MTTTKGVGMYIDLIQYIYKVSNPILIADLIQKEFELEYTIHQISDYLDVNRFEDYETESRKLFNF